MWRNALWLDWGYGPSGILTGVLSNALDQGYMTQIHIIGHHLIKVAPPDFSIGSY